MFISSFWLLTTTNLFPSVPNTHDDNIDIKMEDIKEEFPLPEFDFDHHNHSNGDASFFSASEIASQPDESISTPPKKKGRPKGAKAGTGKKASLRISSQINYPERLPKMTLNVHRKRVSAEDMETLKKLPCFFQPCVCFQIAPKLDQCKECKKQIRKKRHRNKEIDCRFYQFRKLRYVDDEVEVAGFLDPIMDPRDVDKMIWTPNPEKRFKTLSLQNARFILSHVGEQLCSLVQKEKLYLDKYKSDKPIIWKRLIDGVIEICDLCSTTLFNYHFICTKCGLSLCIDCVSESENGNFVITCSTKGSEGHNIEDLSLTQIIVGDCMQKLQRQFHETCALWEVDHDCELMKEVEGFDRQTNNIVKNMLLEVETGKIILGREFLPKPVTLNEVNLSASNIEAGKPLDDFDGMFDEYFKKFRKPPLRPIQCKPIKHRNSHGRDTVISVSRSMSQATSEMLYPNVPHRWLCENKLLRLTEPSNAGNDAFFHEQWQRGQPVLISNVLDNLKQELWIPQAFSAEFGHEKSDLINCMTGRLVRDREISVFWDGFENVEKRMKDNEGTPMLLKLKDWPPDSDFKNIMPSRFEDIMKNLPLNAYTNRTGDLNIVKYLPSCFIHPDLGPKGYFAYGSPFFLKEGTTNLHLDISDACNVMCYIGFPQDKQRSMDEYIEQGLKAILEADCDIANVNRVIEDGEVPGAIWHIYEASDADRIRDFILKIAQERGFKLADEHDVIHDQNWYLDGELRARLYTEYGVKGYAIAQCLGDCIVLPAGTPHQVRNIFSCIKIAEDFVSPQQVAHCLNLSKQFRKLTKVKCSCAAIGAA